METQKLSKSISTLIYTLIFILSLLVLYNFYLIFKNITAPKTPPKNSVKVSPLTGEQVTKVSSSNNIVKVIYDTNCLEYAGISNASIIFESYSFGSKEISALFLEEDLAKNPSMKVISENYSSILPVISFIKNEDLSSYIKNNITKITITINDNINTNFLFINGFYHHLTEGIEDYDPVNNETIVYRNLIVDISSKEPDTLLIFSDGKLRKVSLSSNLNLLQGKTYWLKLNKYSTIKF